MRLAPLLFMGTIVGSAFMAAPGSAHPQTDGSLPREETATLLPEDAFIPFNTLLYWILKLFPVGILVQEAGDLIRAAESVVAAQLGITTTQYRGTTCNDVTIIFARGTGEAGNVGVLVGPELFDAVLARLSGTSATLAVQGVNYAADVSGFLLGGDPAGSQQMQVSISIDVS